VKRIGQVAYKLQLPHHSKIYPVIHISQLKAAIPPTATVSTDASLLCISDDQPIVPEEVLETKLLQVGPRVVPFAWATWENKNTLITRYPQLLQS
jgi:hypothetical protein